MNTMQHDKNILEKVKIDNFASTTKRNAKLQ